ncbi:unnamed protein product [Trichogramma brassicae]|uniref:Uncharacterized protein n=1 Tax=Trichogramma brassicae TaxID=86971 RepID=A0A6H5I5X7_9HYME|nr:unnamed protein product [Trichogramma brassicae]
MLFHRYCRDPKNTSTNRNSAICLAFVRDTRNVVRGLSDDEVRIKWEDVKSAFLCRIQTGQIVNFKHKDDATAFLEDAFTIFEERIKETLAEHSMIKVNVELAAEYMTVNKDGEGHFWR